MSCSTSRILVVDDLADNLLMLKTFLELQGYSVDTAANGTAALEHAQASCPDLILLDVMMPDMDGYEVTRYIRHHADLREIPVVLITAYTDTCRIKGLAAGATDFVRKPIDFDELLDKMESILVHTRNESDCSLAFS